MTSPEIPDFEIENNRPSLETIIARLSQVEINESGVVPIDPLVFAELQGDLGIYFGTQNHFIATKRITEYQNTEDGFEVINPDTINGKYKDIIVRDIGEGNKIYARFNTFKGMDARSPYRTFIVEGYALIPIDEDTAIVALPETEEDSGSPFFDDDKHVQALDLILLNGAVDIDDLENYITTELSELDESILEEYLKYATKVFKNIPLEMAANRVFFFGENHIELCSDEPVYMNGTIEGMDLVHINFEEELDKQDEIRLSFAFKYNGMYFCVLAEDVVSIDSVK